MRIRCVAVACSAGALLAVPGAAARGQDAAPPVVAYRPSVATPADLPEPGWPQMEMGWSGTQGGDTARSQSVPMAFRLAWSESWGLIIGTDAWDWQRDFDGSTAHSGGDTTLELKYRLPVAEGLSFGAEFGAALPTARPPIGSGKTDWGGIGIVSIDSDIAHVDINVGATRFGAPGEGQGRWQGMWAVAASRPIPQGLTVTGEVSGVAQHGTRAQTQGLVGLDYNVTPQLVLDAAVAKGLSRAANDWMLTAGVTFQLGHWF